MIENGTSFAVELEFPNLDFNNKKTGDENYSLYLGQLYIFEEIFDMP